MITSDANPIAASAVEALITLTNDGTATELGVVGALPDNSSTLK